LEGVDMIDQRQWRLFLLFFFGPDVDNTVLADTSDRYQNIDFEDI